MADTPTEAIATVTEKEEPLSETPSAAEETKPENEQPVISETAQIHGSEAEKPKPVDPRKVPVSLGSFKEESSKVADLLDSQKKALDELKLLVREALNKGEFNDPAPAPPPAAVKAEEVKTTGEVASEAPPPAAVEEVRAEPTPDVPNPPPETETPKVEAETLEKPAESVASEVSIWGIPLLNDDRTDVILLKFLRARDFKVKEALTMLKNTIRWRKEFNIDALLDEDLGDDLDKVVFMQGFDKEGHSVCYNVYGEFQNKELYKKAFSDEEKRTNFLRWRIQFLERTIRKLDFTPGGISTFFQITDLKNSPGPAHKELRIATKQALQLLQDNYPEFVAKQVFINVPWWYLAFYTMISPFLTQRTKSKFVFASPSKTADTLYKYISPEQVPIQYGGLSVDLCDCNPDFGIDDQATEITVKPSTKQSVEIQVLEKCVIVWELRVVGWEVSYSAEFIPNAEGAYTIVIHKAKKMTPTDDPVVTSSFKVTELGKIVLSVDNPTSKKKKLVYRFTVKPLAD